MRFFGAIIFGTMTLVGVLLLVLANLTLVAEDIRIGPENWNWDYLIWMAASPVACLGLMVVGILFAMSFARAFRPRFTTNI
ncbi:hypothetical protein [Cerasicoccus arenae]|uniref:Uncharacterized protein n=1 Tax=Cerasicoccus arenae TaxID=424488 RepID=A0A8J3DGF9_9BACT|nr:hypothetical protein [Cerasicoccus arenae]MBK1856659.1 hypothetical protein [Cerasicoccus arenae]GHB98737.1 hypothetical protein GCM10007047_13410 [Cerasicoccus arenae]